MPTLVKAAVWNVKTEVGSAAKDARDLANFTSLLKWQDKLRLLRGAIEAADRAMPIPATPPTGTQVLRLFLAPEYFFAETCNRHVVDYETRGHVVQGLAKLSADVPDMLLMPGTVSYFKPLLDRKLEQKRLAMNPAHASRQVKYAGYFTVGEEKSTFLAHNTAYVFYRGNQVFKYRKMLDAAEINPQDKKSAKVLVFVKGTSSGVFTFTQLPQPLRIGLEVCADHDSGMLSKGGASNLDLQIVLSATVSLKKEFAVLKDGGCLFHCDAAQSSDDGRRRGWQLSGGALADLRDSGAAPAASERMDPLARADLRDLTKTTTKLDTAFENAQLKAARAVMDKPTATAYVQTPIARYLQARGGTVHFYEATIP